VLQGTNTTILVKQMPFNALAGRDCAIRQNRPVSSPRHYRRGPVLRLVCLGARSQGCLLFGTRRIACTLGRSGRSGRKREGDGATPSGRFRLRAVFYRADRCMRPVSSLPVIRLRDCDLWSDDPQDRLYNRPTCRANPGRHETLWRDDRVYDVVVPLGFNDMGVRHGGGSAIFFHLQSTERGATEGCIAVSKPDMDKILAACGATCTILI